MTLKNSERSRDIRDIGYIMSYYQTYSFNANVALRFISQFILVGNKFLSLSHLYIAFFFYYNF